MLPVVEQRGIDLGRREVDEVDKARLVRYLAGGGCLEEWAKKLDITKTKVRGVAVRSSATGEIGSDPGSSDGA